MNQLLKPLLLKLFVIFSTGVYSQNCGLVDSVQTSAVNNGNGTSSYTFTCHLSTTSGGGKSVAMTIYCAADTFIKDTCAPTSSTPTTMVLGPYTIATCGTQILLDWFGYTNSICGGSSCTDTTNVPIPVKYVSYDVKCEGGKTLLNWQTADEHNNAGFEIQMKTSGSDWETILFKEGVNEQGIHTYEVDISQEARIYQFVRIMQKDFNGLFLYSEPIRIQCSPSNEIYFYPNPSNDRIRFNTLILEYEIHDNTGRIIAKGTECTELDISTYVPGIYIIRINDGIREQSLRLIVGS